MIGRFLTLLILMGILLGSVSCGSSPVTYSHCELSVTVDPDYEKRESEDFDLLISNGETAIGVFRISFLAALDQGISDTYTAKGFAAYCMNKTGKSDTLLMRGDVPYYTYVEHRTSGDVYYTVSYFRSMHAYFEVAFASAESDCDEIFDIIDGIYFNDAPEIK